MVETDGAQFEMRWAGPNPFYNPMCFGTVQPYGDGSRIRAGFKISLRDLSTLGIFTAMVTLSLVGRPTSLFYRLLLGLAILMTILFWAKNRSSEPMRAHLIKVLSDAAAAPKRGADPFSAVMSTNGP